MPCPGRPKQLEYRVYKLHLSTCRYQNVIMAGISNSIVLITDNKFDFYNITEIADKKYRILYTTLERIISYTGDFFLFRFTNIKRRQGLAISLNDTSNQKDCCAFYCSCFFSYKTVRVSKLCIN